MTNLGKYEILEEIGRGGFAVVYRARDPELDRIVALKVLHHQLTTDPKFIQRFHQEARAAAGLHHPNIVTVYEVGEEAGQHYLAMAFLPGRALDEWLAEGPLSVEQAVSIVEQIADALDAIHEQGLVHRDVKPGNVMVDDAGQATLLDFGIVRAAEGTRLTTTMAVLGTPEYMAPEQAELEEAAEIDWRADIYALGVVAYEMLVGRPPFTGKSPTAILHKHVYEPPPAPTALNPDLPAGLESVLLKALAKRREERFQHAGTFAARLREAILTESQVQMREAQLALLYERLQVAATQEDWAEVLALGGQIRALDSAYRDVPQLMEQARAQMRRPRRKWLREARSEREPRTLLPTWAWITGSVVVLILLVGLTGLGLGWWAAEEPTPIARPTQVPTKQPTGMPTEAPTERPTEEPTLVPTEEPTLSPGDTWTRPTDEMVMVYVPAGEFEMGSKDDEMEDMLRQCDTSRGDCLREWFDNEQPVHTVVLDGFWIDQTEVTNAQFAAFLNTRGNQEESGVTWLDLESEHCLIQHSNGEFKPKSDRAEYPVIEVSWYGAAAYCEWIGGRLPTEAEWEYVARGRSRYIYPWGDYFINPELNFCDRNCTEDWRSIAHNDRYEVAAPAGRFPAGKSWCGALDMAGNVWEWVADWYDGYPSVEQVNPTGPATGDHRILRGGSWNADQIDVRTARRNPVPPALCSGDVGFRCVVLPGEVLSED